MKTRLYWLCLALELTISITAGAPPNIDSHSGNQNLIEADLQADLWCKVSGNPFPIVTWHKDGQMLNQSERFLFLEYEGSSTGKLVIDNLHLEDNGTYSCIASSGNQTVTAEMAIRVRGKNAALWPFLGIIVEVIILFVIIFISERKKRKQRQDNDYPLGTAAETRRDIKDVRQRKT